MDHSTNKLTSNMKIPVLSTIKLCENGVKMALKVFTQIDVGLDIRIISLMKELMPYLSRNKKYTLEYLLIKNSEFLSILQFQYYPNHATGPSGKTYWLILL